MGESMVNYIPLRVHSVYSRGRGAVAAGELAETLTAQGVSSLAVTDSFSLIAWESFYVQAKKFGMKPLLGVEIAIHPLGTLLLFPCSAKGYFELIAVMNQKQCVPLMDVAAVFLPRQSATAAADTVLPAIRKLILSAALYFGLEWNTGREWLHLAAANHWPLVWAQPVKWVRDAQKWLTAAAVFSHRPLPELKAGYKNGRAALYGIIGRAAILKRWSAAGKDALKNTFALAEKINFDFGVDLAQQFQQSLFAQPDRLLATSVNRVLSKRKSLADEYARTDRELQIIAEMGVAHYFLLAAQVADFCRRKRIYFNLRGSGASSFVLYLLGLSKLNPLNYQLLFERFVNRQRDDLPDIDIDIESSRRSEVLNWVFDTFPGQAAFVSTHKFFQARSALYEIARLHGINPTEAHRLSKEIPMFADPRELVGRGRGEYASIYQQAAALDGIYKELSLHLGGVVFAPAAIRKFYPLEKSPQQFDQMIWDKDTIDRLKIFKLDLLGVRGFDVISPAAIANDADFSDQRVWQAIQQADTIGCFQLESPLSRENLAQAKPTDLNELGIALAIIRPGPAKSGMKQRYVQRSAAIHPILSKIFPYTRGTLIFEEQISVLLHHITGWDLERAEKIRRKLKKKRGGDYAAEFLELGQQRGWSQAELAKIWKLAEDFSLYAFNRSHSTAYAYSAFISAWFKVNHPLVFFCRVFNAGGGYYPLPVYVEAAQKQKIVILPPDVNDSQLGFSVEGESLRTGLIFIKGVGNKLAAKILKERKTGYTDLEDFIRRVGVGERDLAQLMAVSAFESLGINGLRPAEKKTNWKQSLGFLPG
jgi:DNA polymerase III alpha subunit